LYANCYWHCNCYTLFYSSFLSYLQLRFVICILNEELSWVETENKRTGTHGPRVSSYFDHCHSFYLLTRWLLSCKSSYLTLISTLPMCLPWAISLKAASTSSASNTVVSSGFTVPSRSPRDTRSWTVFQSGFPGSNSASSSMPWNDTLRRNTSVPIHKGHRI